MPDLHCDRHGPSEPRDVCDHLFIHRRTADLPALAYHEPAREPGAPRTAIGCDRCEAVVQALGGVDDAFHAFARFHAVCVSCFAQSLERHHPARYDEPD